MIFSLDYEGCFTRDRWFWHEFIKIAKRYGHQVLFASKCYANKNEMPAELVELEFYPTNREAKSPALLRRGIKVDFWIDSNPLDIFYGRKNGEMDRELWDKLQQF